MLNEDQAIFAATLSRNTPQVVDFKLKLTRHLLRLVTTPSGSKPRARDE